MVTPCLRRRPPRCRPGWSGRCGWCPRGVRASSWGSTTRSTSCSPSDTEGLSEQLARVQDAQRVEDLLDGPLHLHPHRADLARQPLLLQDAHAVLTGDRAAEFQTEGHDLVEGLAG